MYFSSMYKLIYIIFLSFVISNCSFKPVVKHHGVPFLEQKQTDLIVNKSNKNDIINLLETDEDTYRTYVVIDKAKL